MANLNKQIPVIVVYEKRKSGRKYMEVFRQFKLDDIIDKNKRNPPIPYNYKILDIGVGELLIEIYKKKYKLIKCN